MAMPAYEAIDKALATLQNYGLLVDHLDLSGEVRRVGHQEDPPRKRNGWYVARELVTSSGRALIIGAYGWWKDPACGDGRWHKLYDRHEAAGLSIDEQREIEARRRDLEKEVQAERARGAAEAASRARAIWVKLPAEGGSPYLARKRVAAFGVRFARGAVIVPVRTGPEESDLTGLQWIQPDGTKRFLTGTAKAGAWHDLIGLPAPGGVLAIAEGYATAATVQMARPDWHTVCAFDAGNLTPVAKALAARCPGAKLVILADDDHRTAGNPGVSKATAAARALKGTVAIPRFGSTDPERGSDWNDLLLAEGLDAVRAQLGALDLGASASAPEPPARTGAVIVGAFPGGEWRDRLMKTEKGAVKASSFNVRLILTHDPAWKGVLGWCDFSQTIQKRQSPPLEHASRGEWQDADDAELRFWLAERYGIEPRGQDLSDAVLGAARNAIFHPVHEYLDNLRWDGKPRLDFWLVNYLGCDPGGQPGILIDDQRRYLELSGRLWMIQAISRVRKPGLKADFVLILEGFQGRGKSTSLMVLFGPEWFSDTPIDIGSKDSFEALRGLWCIEMAELDSLNKADATRAKAFFSSPVDRFRLPYGHRSQRFTRQCVVAGTTNHFQHLRDQTGNRRFWSVSVGAIDLESLARDRDQLWAEADFRFKQGERWWPDPDDLYLFQDQQEARLDGDVWESLIAKMLYDRLSAVAPDRRPHLHITSADIMADALKMDAGMMRRPEQTRVGMIMQALGWRSWRPRVDGLPMRGYRPGQAALAAFETAREARRIGGDHA